MSFWDWPHPTLGMYPPFCIPRHLSTPLSYRDVSLQVVSISLPAVTVLDVLLGEHRQVVIKDHIHFPRLWYHEALEQSNPALGLFSQLCSKVWTRSVMKLPGNHVSDSLTKCVNLLYSIFPTVNKPWSLRGWISLRSLLSVAAEGWMFAWTPGGEIEQLHKADFNANENRSGCERAFVSLLPKHCCETLLFFKKWIFHAHWF